MVTDSALGKTAFRCIKIAVTCWEQFRKQWNNGIDDVLEIFEDDDEVVAMIKELIETRIR